MYGALSMVAMAVYSQSEHSLAYLQQSRMQLSLKGPSTSRVSQVLCFG